MRPARFLPVLALVRLMVVLASLQTAAASAEQALVRNYANPSLEVGQGFLTHYDGTCYLLLPEHVIAEAGATAALLGEGVQPLLGETGAVVGLEDDVALAVVRGALQSKCGYGAQSISRAVSRAIRDNGLATIRSVNGDGSIAQVAVSVLDDDGSRFLRIQPTHSDSQLRKGQSGSLLVAGDRPIGMLLSVDARFGIGKVIRLDAMLDKFDGYVRNRPAATPPAPAAAGTDAGTTAAQAAPGQPLRLLSWTALPATAAERPANLLAMGDGPGWRAEVAAWPVVLEFDLKGERLAIRGLRLESGQVDAELLPAAVEVFISATEGRDRWRSVFGGKPAFAEGAAEILMAPTWARKVRVVFTASNGNLNQIALYRLRVLESL